MKEIAYGNAEKVGYSLGWRTVRWMPVRRALIR